MKEATQTPVLEVRKRSVSSVEPESKPEAENSSWKENKRNNCDWTNSGQL
jgi:hypothetical protein